MEQSCQRSISDPVSNTLADAEAAFAAEQGRKHRCVILPASLITFPLLAMTVPLPYLGKEEPLPYRDPPIFVTDQLPCPLGKKLPSLAQWYDCWGTYAYMHICTRSIQIYFWIFFDFILLSHSFHCLHTMTIFLIFFSIFVVVLFTSKACHFNTALLFRHPHSCTSCRIRLYNMHHVHSLRCAEQS